MTRRRFSSSAPGLNSLTKATAGAPGTVHRSTASSGERLNVIGFTRLALPTSDQAQRGGGGAAPIDRTTNSPAPRTAGPAGSVQIEVEGHLQHAQWRDVGRVPVPTARRRRSALRPRRSGRSGPSGRPALVVAADQMRVADQPADQSSDEGRHPDVGLGLLEEVNQREQR